jgi:hypothetical protein
VVVLAGAGLLAFGQLMGGGGDTSRLTGTNITLGATALPDTVATCGTDPGSLRPICLIDLLKSGASAGVLAVLNADDYIETVTTDHAGYSSSNVYLGFLGTPAATGTWPLYSGGHHTAVTNTFKDGVLVGATRSFRGVGPFTPFVMNDRENQPMVQEHDALATMLWSLSADQQTAAKIDGTYTDILAGAQADDGIAARKAVIAAADAAVGEKG